MKVMVMVMVMVVMMMMMMLNGDDEIRNDQRWR